MEHACSKTRADDFEKFRGGGLKDTKMRAPGGRTGEDDEEDGCWGNNEGDYKH